MPAYRCRSLRRTGSSHRFCQDRFQIWAGEDRLILTAADGHGGRPYSRSGLGARFACSAGVKLLRSGICPEDFPMVLKDRFDTMVHKHLAQHPLEDWERERLEGRPQEVAYGATFLGALMEKDGAWLFQLGDGDIHALGRDGTFLPALARDRDCAGNLTTSLVNERAYVAKHFRLGHYDCPLGAVMLYTDGCEGALLPAMDALTCLPELGTRLERVLTRTARGDDQTFLLALDPASAGTEEFQQNLRSLTDALTELNRKRRQRNRWQQEYEQLRSYLQLAVRKAKRMAAWGDPGLDQYLAALDPQYRRMKELQQLLDMA